ncbi:sensor histidine kinase [Nocardia suismassiliense]|uniref:sensor histidine kinase n=1 Tax=Nocardia suismassiliense TaxID=2077092 RepID=UPI000D1E0093|nr:HAMP domain-containing sensor histidine kinase [Nocardia suismassiliense]
MSSSPQAEPVRRVRPPRQWSLRARLLFGQALLLVAVVAGIGVATELVLGQFMVHQLDSEVIDLQKRSLADSGGGPSLGPPPVDQPPQRVRPPASTGPAPDFLDRRGIPPGAVGAIVDEGTVTKAAKIGSDGTQSTLSGTALQQVAVVPATGDPVTIDVDGLGRYRVVASANWTGQIVVFALPLAAVDATMVRVLVVLVIGTVIVLIVALTVGIWLIRRALAPLDRVAATAARVADLPLARGEVALAVRVAAADADPRTEVGQLGSAVNRMLDHVTCALSARHDSETRVRRFLADASHELRTPLAAIRGYAELAQRKHAEVPADVANAMSRVHSESRRMTALVEDMLLLARLDSGRGLEHEPVDLTQLTVDAVSDAHIAGPRHQWNLELPDDPVMIAGDASRLHQVLANLLANARVHTEPGTTVTVSLEIDGAGAVLRVSDDGPGIPEALQSEVFERFARGDSSRSRRAGSTGLGLAIVAAVVAAHGGEISVDSRPGRTEFTVRLPDAEVAVAR